MASATPKSSFPSTVDVLLCKALFGVVYVENYFARSFQIRLFKASFSISD